jgi:hypothetical protein
MSRLPFLISVASLLLFMSLLPIKRAADEKLRSDVYRTSLPFSSLSRDHLLPSLSLDPPEGRVNDTLPSGGSRRRNNDKGRVPGKFVFAARLSAMEHNVSSTIHFTDLTEQSRLVFRHQDGGVGNRFLPEHMGAGLCSFDADNDGLIDVYLLNGAELPGAKITPRPTNEFFRNVGGFQFRNSTLASGLQDFSYSLGVTAADFDEDGFQDLYVSNFGKNRLFKNNGDGTFVDVTQFAGVADGDKFGAGVTFLDVDGDGFLDLFVGNYVNFSFERHQKLAPTAHPYSPGPKDFAPTPDALFKNNGDGTFSDISKQSGLTSVAGPSMGVVAIDFDFDQDTDIFVACDGAPNLLYVNNGQGVFAEEALLAGLAFDSRGIANGSMGVDSADLNGDGFPDLLVTDYSEQQPEYFRNLPPGGVFEECSRLTQIGTEVYPHVNWGVGTFDFDLDGDIDVFICNGHLLENAKEIEPQTDYGVPNTVMENLNNSTFRSATANSGEALRQARISRGAVFDDFDNDGQIDVVVLNCDAEAQVLRNSIPKNHSWLMLELIGRRANRDAIGAKVWVHANGKKFFMERVNGRGYQSHYSKRLHFGIGSVNKVDRIEILWPGREKNRTVIENVPANQILTILDGH